MSENKTVEIAALPSGTLSEIAKSDTLFGVKSWSVDRGEADVRAVGQMAAGATGVVEYLRGVAAYNAVAFGHVGEGKPFAKMGDLQSALSFKAPGELSRSVDLGRAAVTHGVAPGSPRWTRVAKAVRGSGKTATAVKEHLRGAKGTMTALDTLLDAFDANPTGKTTAGNGEGNGEGNGDAPTVKVPTVTPERVSKATPAANLAMVKANLAMVTTVIASADKGLLEQIAEVLAEVTADCQTRLAGDDESDESDASQDESA